MAHFHEHHLLQFAPFSSSLDAGFWHTLSEKKLNDWKLDEKAVSIYGTYYNGDASGLPSRMNIDYTAFVEEPTIPPGRFYSPGILYNKNTLDSFKDCDKKELLDSLGREIWENIKSGQIMTDPSMLDSFLMLTYADLKKYHYYYWFGFPALCLPESVSLLTKPEPIRKHLNDDQIDQLQLYVQDILHTSTRTGYFLMLVKNNVVEIGDLHDFNKLYSTETSSKLYLCFCDPCTLDDHPGWPLRNLLAFAAYHWSELWPDMNILCYRNRYKDGRRNCSHSIILKLHVPSIKQLKECPKVVGWEKNAKQKLGPRMVNLSSSMDPARLAESSVDLNLKLMRWRLLPELDLDKIAKTKCLLLGSGTLGCNIARNLMGWGVRNITLVDNSTISYSNPVRQSLFVFEDCVEGGKPKAETAAEALKKIFPGVNARGISLSIPMPGHAVIDSDLEQTRKDVTLLEELIEGHDVIFLLMDTRESRWLPTVIGAAKRKLVINVALGFDTYLVVRHGLKSDRVSMDTETQTIPLNSAIPGDQLGCYFCNDVVAPGDSTRDRTLDQQCTVSRPGMSYIAGALASELLISLLQHPSGGYAPGDTSATDHLGEDSESILGLVPHQIRGFLSRFHNLMPASRVFDKCTACSNIVTEKYKKNGFDFLINAFNVPSYLEDLTGLTQLQIDTMDVEVWDLSDDESI